MHSKRIQCTFFACTKSASFRCKKCFNDLCTVCFAETHSNPQLPQFVEHRAYVKRLKDMNRNEETVQTDFLELVRNVKEGKQLERLHTKFSEKIAELTVSKEKMLEKRNRPLFSQFVSVGVSVTSLCHARCEKLIEQERVHLERRLVTVDSKISALRNRQFSISSIKSALDSFADESMLHNALINGSLNAKFFADGLANISVLDHELDELDTTYSESKIDHSPLHSLINEFFDEAERKISAFYDASTTPATANQTVSQVAPVSTSVEPNEGGNGNVATLIKQPSASATKKDEPKRKANSALETIANAAAASGAKSGAKKSRKASLVAPAQFETIREEDNANGRAICAPTFESQTEMIVQTLPVEGNSKIAPSQNEKNTNDKLDNLVKPAETGTVSTAAVRESVFSETESNNGSVKAGVNGPESDSEMASVCDGGGESAAVPEGYYEPLSPCNGDSFECYVVHVETLEEIYIVRSSDHGATNGPINDAIQQLLTEKKPGITDVQQIVAGGMYIAQFDDDGKWYRASVSNVNEAAETVTVRFIDFGNERVLKLQRTDECDPKIIPVYRGHAPTFLTETPAQALRCTLFGVDIAASNPSAHSAKCPTSPSSASMSTAALPICSNVPTKSVAAMLEQIYSQLLDVLLVARVINVRKLFTLGSGCFLPSCTGNPTTCEVLLCFTDNLASKMSAEEGVNVNVTDIWHKIESSVQLKFSRFQPPLVTLTKKFMEFQSTHAIKSHADASLGPNIAPSKPDAGMNLPVAANCNVQPGTRTPKLPPGLKQVEQEPTARTLECNITRNRVAIAAEAVQKQATSAEPSPFAFGVQAARSVPKTEAARKSATRAYSVQMEAPVYITCVEAPNAIYIVHRREEIVRQIFALHSELEGLVKTDRSLGLPNRQLNEDNMSYARTYLLNTFVLEFRKLESNESNSNISCRWRKDAAQWTDLAVPCAWKSDLMAAPDRSSPGPSWLRGLIVHVDFADNSLSIVSVDYGGTARLPLVPLPGTFKLPVWMRLTRLMENVGLQTIPPFATCVALADLVSAGVPLPLSYAPASAGTYQRAPQENPLRISDGSDLAVLYTTHMHMGWVTKAVEAFGHAVFVNPDWDPAEQQYGDHLPIVIHSDGTFEDAYDRGDTGSVAPPPSLRRNTKRATALKSVDASGDLDMCAADDEYQKRRKLDQKVQGDVLAQHAVYLRMPGNSVFSGFDQYETIKQGLANWLHAGCTAPLPLDGSLRIAFRWPKAGVNLFVKQRRTPHSGTSTSALATSSTAVNDSLTDYVSLGDLLVRTGLAFKLAIAR